MNISNNKRFYYLSIAILAILSAYPLINGVRMAIISAANGALEPEQYARYIVPYAAICVSLLFFAALQPLFFKLRRLAFPLGIGLAYGVFLAVERFFETMQIHVSELTLIETGTLMPAISSSNATADVWQLVSCAISPAMMGQSLSYEFQDRFYYVLGDSAYKIHYYLIALMLITMVCGLIYGIAKMLRTGDAAQKKPLLLRGVSTAALVALCVFANSTAFFRQAAAIQTPLASVLTGLFFIILGAAVGVYVGSYLLDKGKRLGIAMPVLLSIGATIAMYAGEAAMMKGNLYRFGAGWFFGGLLNILLAPADILIVLLSAGLAWLILAAARKHKKWPSQRVMIAAVAICAAVAAMGPLIALAAPALYPSASSGATGETSFSPSRIAANAGVLSSLQIYREEGILGCYVFDREIYTNPLNSNSMFGLQSVYGFGEDIAIIADTRTGALQSYGIRYCKTPVAFDEFLPNKGVPAQPDFAQYAERFQPSATPFSPPSLAQFKERYLLAVISNNMSPEYGLYQLDNEIWLVELWGSGVWCINRLVKTNTTTYADLQRALELNMNTLSAEQPSGILEYPMTLKDVYALARKGKALSLQDFEPFHYLLMGEDFSVRRYDVVGADTVFVCIKNDMLESALLESRRAIDSAQAIDLREGFEAVAKYMDPLCSFMDITIERALSPKSMSELLFEDDYFLSECQYYLPANVAQAYVIFNRRDERMTVREALEERRISIEDAVAKGLDGVSMVPIDNPLGGVFTALHRQYKFTLNSEAFYPSKSFMYVVWEDNYTVYYDIDELAQILELYGYGAAAEKLRKSVDPSDITAIACGNYVRDTALAQAGLAANVGWELSSHTPVRFVIE